MVYSTENCCGKTTIHIESSDFCKKCHRFLENWQGEECNECRKIPVTFADGLE